MVGMVLEFCEHVNAMNLKMSVGVRLRNINIETWYMGTL